MYCEEENIEILGVIPYSREAAEIYSSGKIMANLPEYREAFRKIADRLREIYLGTDSNKRERRNR